MNTISFNFFDSYCALNLPWNCEACSETVQSVEGRTFIKYKY